jgi:hypothetical protein
MDTAPSEHEIPQPDVAAHWERLWRLLPTAVEAVGRIGELLRDWAPRPDLGQVVQLSTVNPVAVEKFGRRYYRVWATGALTLSVDSPVGPTSINLAAGWNILNLPDGTRLTLASGNAANVYVLASDHPNT